MSTRRFFCETPIDGASEYALQGSENQHLTRVLRAKAGDEVILFDGTGIECLAVVQDVRRNETRLTIASHVTIDRELAQPITLAVALPKGDRQQWIVEKAVELGITSLLPLKTEFGVAQPAEKARQRIQRQIISASKQCGRNKLMQLLDPMTIAKLVDDKKIETRLVVAHPTGTLVTEVAKQSIDERLVLLVGPEGGFSDKEIELASERSCEIVSLGVRILRIETAAVALASRFIYA